jgi:hypothetical protein
MADSDQIDGERVPEARRAAVELNYATDLGAAPAGAGLITIATFAQSWEAHLAVGRLEEMGIPAAIADENIVATGGGLYTNMTGGVKVQVPRAEAGRALAALPRRVRAKIVFCPKCRSEDTRQIEFSPGVKALFLLMLGLPYLFVQRPWYCVACGNAWRPVAVKEDEADDEDEDWEDDDDDDDDDDENDGEDGDLGADDHRVGGDGDGGAGAGGADAERRVRPGG